MHRQEAAGRLHALACRGGGSCCFSEAAPGVLEAENVTDLGDDTKGLDKVLAGVRGRETEAGAGLDDGGGGVTHHDNTDAPLLHLAAERAAVQWAGGELTV